MVKVALPFVGAKVTAIATMGALFTIPPVELTMRGSTRSRVPVTVTGFTSLRTFPAASRSCNVVVVVGAVIVN
jgi:hypothetical protein